MRISGSAARNALVLLCALFTLPLQLAQAQGQRASVSYEEKKRQTNDIAVTIVTSGLSCTCARFAEDIRNVVNDLRPDGCVCCQYWASGVFKTRTTCYL